MHAYAFGFNERQSSQKKLHTHKNATPENNYGAAPQSWNQRSMPKYLFNDKMYQVILFTSSATRRALSLSISLSCSRAFPYLVSRLEVAHTIIIYDTDRKYNKQMTNEYLSMLSCRTTRLTSTKRTTPMHILVAAHQCMATNLCVSIFLWMKARFSSLFSTRRFIHLILNQFINILFGPLNVLVWSHLIQ